MSEIEDCRTKSQVSRKINISLKATLDNVELETLLKNHSNDPAVKVNILSRICAELRSKLSKLNVKFNDL